MTNFINLNKLQKFFYYLSNGIKLIVPKSIYRKKCNYYLQELEKKDKENLLNRLDYYIPNALKPLGNPAIKLTDFKLPKRGSMYFFDLVKYTNYFNQNLKITYKFGDVTENFKNPTITKSRPINHNGNSVLMKLDSLRHYNFINDTIPYSQKEDNVVWRGVLHNEKRKTLVKKFHNHPQCNINQVSIKKSDPDWINNYLSIEDQLQYKFILSIEGIDVATNLKWIFSSNSLCFMPTPKFETWFMEGKLIPNVHYVHIKDDFSDLIEKMEYYNTHEKEALEIIKNQQNWATQFKNKHIEKTLSLLVLDRFFKITGQYKN